MNTSDGRSPERLLSAALRAQAVGGLGPGEAEGPPEPPGTHREGKPGAGRLPVGRVLLAALLLGLFAGAVAGWFSIAGWFPVL